MISLKRDDNDPDILWLRETRGSVGARRFVSSEGLVSFVPYCSWMAWVSVSRPGPLLPSPWMNVFPGETICLPATQGLTRISDMLLDYWGQLSESSRLVLIRKITMEAAGTLAVDINREMRVAYGKAIVSQTYSFIHFTGC